MEQTQVLRPRPRKKERETPDAPTTNTKIAELWWLREEVDRDWRE